MIKFLSTLWVALRPALSAALVALLTYALTHWLGASNDAQLAAGSGVFTYASYSRGLSHLFDKHKINAQTKIALAKVVKTAGTEALADVVNALSPTPTPTGAVATATPGAWVPATAQVGTPPAVSIPPGVRHALTGELVTPSTEATNA